MLQQGLQGIKMSRDFWGNRESKGIANGKSIWAQASDAKEYGSLESRAHHGCWETETDMKGESVFDVVVKNLSHTLKFAVLSLKIGTLTELFT